MADVDGDLGVLQAHIDMLFAAGWIYTDDDWQVSAKHILSAMSIIALICSSSTSIATVIGPGGRRGHTRKAGRRGAIPGHTETTMVEAGVQYRVILCRTMTVSIFSQRETPRWYRSLHHRRMACCGERHRTPRQHPPRPGVGVAVAVAIVVAGLAVAIVVIRAQPKRS